jgi:hypothetical protein
MIMILNGFIVNIFWNFPNIKYLEKYIMTTKSKQFVKKDDLCDELFQIEMINNDFFEKWKVLKSLHPLGQETNCAPNVLFFLGIIKRNEGEKLSYQTECNKHNLGMHLDKVGSVLEAFNRAGIHVRMYKIPIERLFETFELKLYTNHVTFFDIRRRDGLGHSLAIGKTNNDELIVFDPQQLKIYKGETNIHKYLVDVLKATAFTTFCNEDEKKRKNDGFDSIKKNHDNEPASKIQKGFYQTDVHEPPFTKDILFSHGTIPTNPKRKASKRLKNNGGKRKTTHSKRKTTHSKRKTTHSKRKTTHSKRKTKHSKKL